MHYVKVATMEDGGSRFVDMDVDQTEAPYAQNVPPLFVSQPVPGHELMFVTMPDDVRDTEPHPGAATSVRDRA